MNDGNPWEAAAHAYALGIERSAREKEQLDAWLTAFSARMLYELSDPNNSADDALRLALAHTIGVPPASSNQRRRFVALLVESGVVFEDVAAYLAPRSVAGKSARPPLPWPPTTHRLIAPIRLRGQRVFIAEFVRHIQAGAFHDDAIMGAMRAAFPRSRTRVTDKTTRARGQRHYDRYRGVIEALLDPFVDAMEGDLGDG